MPIEHDGISCPLPLQPVSWVLGLAFLGLGGWQIAIGGYAPGAGALVVGLLVVANQFGSRRVRVIESKLVVEDSRAVVALLIGPRRSRIHWEEVRAVQIAGRSLRLETTKGPPFVTAQGATPSDLDALKALVDKVMAKAAKRGATSA